MTAFRGQSFTQDGVLESATFLKWNKAQVNSTEYHGIFIGMFAILKLGWQNAGEQPSGRTNLACALGAISSYLFAIGVILGKSAGANPTGKGALEQPHPLRVLGAVGRYISMGLMAFEGYKLAKKTPAVQGAASLAGQVAKIVRAKTMQAEHDEQQAILKAQKPEERVISIADQVARFARSKDEIHSKQYYNHPEQYYDGVKAQLKGKRILITGAEQGLGLELVKLIVAEGGHAIQAGRNSSSDLDAVAKQYPGQVTIINGIDVTKDEAMSKMVEECKTPVDIVMNSAGYFYGPTESVGVGCEGHMNFQQNLLQINICAVGPLRITNALYKGGKIVPKGKVIIITSQAGSCDWRFTQNGTPKPGDGFDGNYGHHMSRAACNIMGVILSQELKAADLSVQMMHPGFNRTAMTQKYAHIWDIEGAVEPIVGAKRVLYQTLKSSMDTSGSVINCEDGLRIPW